MIDVLASQCGDVREVKITKLANFQVAAVELSNRVWGALLLPLGGSTDAHAGRRPCRPD